MANPSNVIDMTALYDLLINNFASNRAILEAQSKILAYIENRDEEEVLSEIEEDISYFTQDILEQYKERYPNLFKQM